MLVYLDALLFVVIVVLGVVLVALVSTALHELGHMLAALLVGYRVRGLVIRGRYYGRSRFRRSEHDHMHAATVAGPRMGQPAGWRLAVFAGGGIVASLAVTVAAATAAFAVLAAGPWPASALWRMNAAEMELLQTATFLVLALGALRGVVIVAGNTWPRRLRAGRRNDGLVILHALRRPEYGWVEFGHASIDIDRELADVWEYMVDPSRFHEYEPSVRRAYFQRHRPVGVGSILVIESAPHAGTTRRRRQKSEIVEFDPPRRLVQDFPDQPGARSLMLLDAVGTTGTRLTHATLLRLPKEVADAWPDGLEELARSKGTLAQLPKFRSDMEQREQEQRAQHAEHNEAIKRAIDGLPAKTASQAPEPDAVR